MGFYGFYIALLLHLSNKYNSAVLIIDKNLIYLGGKKYEKTTYYYANSDYVISGIWL